HRRSPLHVEKRAPVRCAGGLRRPVRSCGSTLRAHRYTGVVIDLLVVVRRCVKTWPRRYCALAAGIAMIVHQLCWTHFVVAVLWRLRAPGWPPGWRRAHYAGIMASRPGEVVARRYGRTPCVRPLPVSII